MFQKSVKGIAIGLIGLFAFSIPSATAMDVSVSPPRWELEINGKATRTKTIKVLNLSNEPLDIKAYVRNWTMSNENQLQESPSNEQSLDQWIVFTPSKVTIPPRSTQTVRFDIRPKVKPTVGEHRAVIFLEEIPRGGNEGAQSVVTVGRVGVTIYAYAGEVKRVGSINSVIVDTKPHSIKAVFDVSSSGNAHVRMKGQYAIWRAGNYPGAKATQNLANLGNPKSKLPDNILDAGYIELPPVLPSHRRQLILPITKKLSPGNYVLDINGDLSGVAVDQGISFTVK